MKKHSSKAGYYRTDLGMAHLGNSLEIMRSMPSTSIDLVLTSPPFALLRKKSYGNVAASEYCDWFMPFAHEIRRLLKPTGSLVLDIGGSWNKGLPTRSLYHFELLLRLCRPDGPYHLAQEFYWYNPAKMPTPAQWVTVKRVRVKDSVNPIWWLSRSARPKASNRRVLKPYSKSMEMLLKKGYNDGARPSEHKVSKSWGKRQKGAIPPNLIIASNTSSTDPYLRACRKHDLMPNPARFVKGIPEFFVKFLTVPGNVVLDPFAGSNVVGAVCEALNRRWISVELSEEFLVGSAFRFDDIGQGVLRKYSDRTGDRLKPV